MRAAQLTREFPPEVYGGAGVHVEYLAAALDKHVDVAVHCFGAARDGPLVAATYQPWEALEGSAPHLGALRTFSVDLAMAAGVEGADLVHSHTWYANLAGHLAKLLYDIPHVATTHSLEPQRPWKAEQLGGGYALSTFAEGTALAAADAVVAVSERMRADVLASYPGVDPERVVVIHNGIDTAEYQSDPRTDVLTARGIDPDRPIVLFVGRITRQKGITHLLDAAEHLAPEAQLVLCAGAPDTAALEAEVTDAVQRLRRQREGVHWLAEMLPRPDVVQLLSHTTVFVCPSIYEPFGLVNVEAMACGAAVVTSAVGGIPEVVVHGETGLLTPFEASGDAFGTPSDPDGFARRLAEQINTLVTDPALAAAYGDAGRRRVAEHFSWDAIAERTAGLYRQLVSAATGSAV
ncbi:MAG: glycogen synthase [Egibacteraceae bacterium]